MLHTVLCIRHIQLQTILKHGSGSGMSNFWKTDAQHTNFEQGKAGYKVSEEISINIPVSTTGILVRQIERVGQESKKNKNVRLEGLNWSQPLLITQGCIPVHFFLLNVLLQTYQPCTTLSSAPKRKIQPKLLCYVLLSENTSNFREHLTLKDFCQW